MEARISFVSAPGSGVALRLVMRNFSPVYHAVMAGTATPEQALWVQRKMKAAKRTVVFIWIFISIAAALGLWKPF